MNSPTVRTGAALWLRAGGRLWVEWRGSSSNSLSQSRWLSPWPWQFCSEDVIPEWRCHPKTSLPVREVMIEVRPPLPGKKPGSSRSHVYTVMDDFVTKKTRPDSHQHTDRPGCISECEKQKDKENR